MPSYKITTVHQFKPQDYAQGDTFSQSCKNKLSSDSGFFRRPVFAMNVSFTSRDLQTHRTYVLGATKSQKYSKTLDTHQKVTVWCDVQSNGVIDPYYFYNVFHGVNYYQILLTCIRPEAPKFLQKTAFQQEGVPLLLHELSVLIWMKCFPNSWTRIYCQAGPPAKSPDLAPLDFSTEDLGRNKLSGFCSYLFGT